jgi:hypothetical protein
MVPQPCVHDAHWLVKYGKRGSATAELYADELRMMHENPFAEPIWRAFEIAGIEYGRADFGLVGGRPQVYEINTNPQVKPGEPHPSATRMASMRIAWQKLLAAFRELDPGPLPGPPIAVRDRRLERHQGLRGRFVRSRFAP